MRNQETGPREARGNMDGEAREASGSIDREACEAWVPARNAAFTLIEIMAVVIIIGLLTTIVGAAIFQQVDKGRVTTAKAQINSLEGVLELYRMDNGRFPTSEQGLEALVNAPTSEPSPRNYPAGGYLKGGRVPMDPWGSPFLYEAPGQNNAHSFDLWSEGADGSPGGEGTDMDIGNWTEESEPS